MIDVKKERTYLGNDIQIIKGNDVLSFLLTQNKDLIISIFTRENPNMFNVNLSDNNLYLLIDKFYNYIKNNSNKYNNLFHDEIIDYYSDDTNNDEASRFIIMNNNYDYNLIITRDKFEDDGKVVIIAKNSKKYNNSIFFDFYEKLNTYDIKTRKLER